MYANVQKPLVLLCAVISLTVSQTCSAIGGSLPCFPPTDSQGDACPSGTCQPDSTGTLVCCSAAETVPAVTTAASVTVATTSTCVDLLNPVTGVSDCPRRAFLCSDSVYYDVMTVQCPLTCGRCGYSTSSTSCVDQVNPSTGVSDCPSRAYLCNNSVYYSLMTTQCPATCGRCSSSSVTVSSSTTCVDQGTDCPGLRSYCTNSIYRTLMAQQCPVTCGVATIRSNY